MKTLKSLLLLTGTLALASFAPFAHAGDGAPQIPPLEVLQLPDLKDLPELQVAYPLPLPLPLLTRDLKPVPNPITGKYFDPVVIGGSPFVRIWIRNVGILPAGASVARVVFQRNWPIPNVVMNVAYPALAGGAMAFRVVPVPPLSFNPTLDYGVRADTFNAVPESNEWNNVVIIHQ